MKKKLLYRVFLSAILATTVISAKASDDEYHNLGCQGNIVLYASERCTLDTPFPEFFKDYCDWYVRKVYTNSYEDYQITGNGTYGGLDVYVRNTFRTVDVTSYASSENLPYKFQIYCKRLIVYMSGRRESYECYWNITWKERERIIITASPEGGSILAGSKVYLKASKSDAKIYYTTNGSIPWEKSPVYTSSGIIIDKDMTLKAIAYSDGDPKYITSEVTSWTFTVNILIEKITLNSSSLTLAKDKTYQLTSTVTPTNATDKSVTWSSSNTAVATVSSSGLVTAKSPGTATITCKANDGSGVTAKCTVDVHGPIVAEINASNFPDANFRNYLLSMYYNGYITDEDIENCTSIYYNSTETSTLKGIEFFTALQVLSCSFDKLTTIDVSKNIALKKLYCHDNSLTELDVSKNTALTDLNCYDNQLFSLDISKNEALTDLACYNNLLKELDVTRNTALTDLRCFKNKLTSLDISKNTALKTLWCYSNQLTSLDVSKNTALTLLGCYNNDIKGEAMDKLISSLPQNKTSDIHRFIVVGEDLAKEGNVCTVTQVEAAKAKGWTPCYYDSSTKEYVEYEGSEEQPAGIVISEANFPDVNFRNYILAQSYGTDGVLTDEEIKGVTIINVTDKGITNLKGIELFTALTVLDCSKNKLTVLDVSKNTKLTQLHCNGNQLSALDVTKNTALKGLWCGSNLLTSLDVSKNTALEKLICNNNKLKKLDLSSNKALITVNCGLNPITTLDMSNSVNLTDLSANRCSIKGADMDALITSLSKSTTGMENKFYVINNIANDEGNVCTKTQVATLKAKGWSALYYDGKEKAWLEYEGSDDEQPALKGDVNEDEKVNGTDLVALTNIILDKNAQKTSADVNGDGKVNGTDYVALANLILGKTAASRSLNDGVAVGCTATLQVEPLTIRAGETRELTVSLTNPDDELTLLQFDLLLPDGLYIDKVGDEPGISMGSRTSEHSHQLSTYADGQRVRCLLASPGNELVDGKEGAVVRMTVTASSDFNGGTLTLVGGIVVTPDEQEVTMPVQRYVLTGETTGVYGLSQQAEDASDVYSLSGHRQGTMTRGVNIVNGKKIIRK